MTYLPPRSIELTDTERQLCSEIEPYLDGMGLTHESWHDVAEVMEALAVSLFEREAIPEIRARIFMDRDLSESGKKAICEVFEENGVPGGSMYRDPHFLPYLRYFIRGPRLPASVIEGFCRILNDDQGPSMMVEERCGRFVRKAVRDYEIRQDDAATQFFRLCVELGLRVGFAREMRKEALSAR